MILVPEVTLAGLENRIFVQTNAFPIPLYPFVSNVSGRRANGKSKISELITRQVSRLVHSYLKPSLLARSAAETWLGRDLRANLYLPNGAISGNYRCETLR